MKLNCGLMALLAACTAAFVTKRVSGPFLTDAGNSTWVIGNELWNLTQGQQYATKLYYMNHDCVGDAVGHYVSYSKSDTLNCKELWLTGSTQTAQQAI
jgi:rhamnogalacturonan endolyase